MKTAFLCDCAIVILDDTEKQCKTLVIITGANKASQVVVLNEVM